MKPHRNTIAPNRHALQALLVCIIFFAAAAGAAAQQAGLAGYWQGTLTPGAMKLRVAFRIVASDAGGYTCTLDSPDQSVEGIPVESVEARGDSVILAVPSVQGAYRSMRSDDTTLTGTWKQGGAAFPLVLHRGDKPAELRRPQLPTKPYPYIEREVVFVNAIAGDSLAGTLTMPRGEGPFPAVVLVTGSGAQDRDEQIFGHRPFLVLADHLTRNGIAVLRYDDRGFGKSTGSVAAATTLDFTDDALAGVAFLRGTRGIRADRIGVAGHSEGGLIAPIAAVRSTDVAFIILLAGPGIPGDSLLVMQSDRILAAMGQDDDVRKQSTDLTARMLAVAVSDRDSADATAACIGLLKAYLASQPDSVRGSAGNSDVAIDQKVKQLLSPWFRTFLRLDPRIYLREVHCPVLALNGEKDLQVPVPENTDALKEAFRAGGNPDATVVVLPGLNHLFQTAKTGSITEYGEIEETFSPTALETISAWILERVK